MTTPSGLQVEIVSGGQRAWLTEVGAGLRRYVVDGRDVLHGYGADETAHSGRGQLLLPWPNRIADGRYRFAGEDRQLSLTEPEARTAIHGLVRWANWTVREREPHRAMLVHRLHPQPGYPHVLDLTAEYALADAGLTVRLTATNAGDAPCPFGAGAHPYLAPAGDRIDGTTLSVPAATRLRSDERGIPVSAEPVDGGAFDFRTARPVGATRLDTAYTDLARDADGRARVRFGETTLWVDEGFPWVMVFTGDLPDVDRRGLAVEPMTCPPNAFQSGEELLTLAPGETFSASFGIAMRANAS